MVTSTKRPKRVDKGQKMKVKFVGEVPVKGTEGAAGYDLVAKNGCTILPGATVAVDTGLSIEMMEDMVGDVRPRSSMSKKGVLVHYGTIDSDYRGTIKVLMTNLTDWLVNIKSGDRVAQLVFLQLPTVELELVDELSTTGRGIGGFGSTGV